MDTRARVCIASQKHYVIHCLIYVVIMGILHKREFEGGTGLHEWGEKWTRKPTKNPVNITFRHPVNSCAEHALLF